MLPRNKQQLRRRLMITHHHYWFSKMASRTEELKVIVRCVLFPSIAALARVWLGRSPSNAFQERVFSTRGFIMSNLRTRTDNQRAEMQVLLRHNRDEIRQMERLGDANI
ncbi:hypothetical protein PHMEG_0007302 [Phytophthora megakarya]|uniref:HAT C-terminal dimerisation domain-containing protein n=1 Tax=Phytophthora megakarya TaxID=4795 RepID=A0A225WNN9_9STRA|nr:hypothetical protein PHMEG_0007302 [Phytophthora megakarya]